VAKCNLGKINHNLTLPMAAFPFSMYNQQGGRRDLLLTLAVIELIFADHFAAL